MNDFLAIPDDFWTEKLVAKTADFLAKNKGEFTLTSLSDRLLNKYGIDANRVDPEAFQLLRERVHRAAETVMEGVKESKVSTELRSKNLIVIISNE